MQARWKEMVPMLRITQKLPRILRISVPLLVLRYCVKRPRTNVAENRSRRVGGERQHAAHDIGGDMAYALCEQGGRNSQEPTMRSRHETAKGLLSAESDNLCMEAMNAPGAVIVMLRKSGVVSTLVSPTVVDRSTHLSMLLSPVRSAGACLV